MRSMGRGEGVSEGVDGGEGVNGGEGVGRSMLGGEGVHVRWGSIHVGDRGSREIHAGRGRGPRWRGSREIHAGPMLERE